MDHYLPETLKCTQFGFPSFSWCVCAGKELGCEV